MKAREIRLIARRLSTSSQLIFSENKAFIGLVCLNKD